MKKGIIKKNQIWVDKQTGKMIKISNKASGNLHWTTIPLNGKTSHHLHEGTIQKFYKLLKEEE